MSTDSAPAVPPATGPLAGIRVLDCSSFIAGSFASMLLGDLGADVIKIEAPIGDLARYWAPFLNGEPLMFQGWNRNKRGLGLDLNVPAALEIIDALVRSADILVENFRPGVTEKLGIHYERLRSINPRLIYCSSTAFGNKGPDRFRPGYDPVFQTIGGVARFNTVYAGKPSLTAVAVSDFQASMLIVTGATSALYHRERTGHGQLVETSLLQGVMSIQSHFFVEPLDTAPQGVVGIFPYHLFETADSPFFLGAPTDKFWQLACEVLGLQELAADPRYRTNTDRVQHQAELSQILTERLKTKPAGEWEQLLAPLGIPCGALGTHQDLFHAPQTAAMEMNPVIHHATAGRLRVAGVPL
ncbi:MAG: CoA transferase, partial [Planctomycetales bacterium]